MRLRAVFLLQVVVVHGHVIVADQVRDARGRNGGLEPGGLRHQPVRELAAVALALDAEPLAIDPWVAGENRVDGGEHVLRFSAVLVARDRVGELLAVAG